jgi:hypothetical protein
MPGEAVGVYYTRLKTRGPGAASAGSPSDAFNYIGDGHDEHETARYSAAELEYIARSGDGWKTELEGGPVPVLAHGTLKDVAPDKLRDAWQDACQPYHDKRATTGYLSWSMTIPKELSLLADGRRQEVRDALQRAAQAVLEQAFSGLDYAAVSAVHTRNGAAESHHHVHILISKFARDRETGKTFSLNNNDFGRMTRTAVHAIKLAWKREVDRELSRCLEVQIEQTRSYGPISVTTKEGTRLPALNRESRRVLEKLLAPKFVEQKDGQDIHRRLWLCAMDDRIYEVAHRQPWSMDRFKQLFEDQAPRASRYAKRVELLKRVGYLDADGAITPAFRLHQAARKGTTTPELLRLRLDLQREIDRQEAAGAAPIAGLKSHQDVVARYTDALLAVLDRGIPIDPSITKTLSTLSPPGPDLWTTIDRLERIRHRIANLGIPQSLGSGRGVDVGRMVQRAFANGGRARRDDQEFEYFGRLFGQFFTGGWIPKDPNQEVVRALSGATDLPIATVEKLLPLLAQRDRALRDLDTGSSHPTSSAESRAAAPAAATTPQPPPPDTKHAEWLQVPPQDRSSSRTSAPGARQGTLTPSQTRALRMLQAGVSVLRKYRLDLLDAIGRWTDRHQDLVRQVIDQASGQRPATLDKSEFEAAVVIGRVGFLALEERRLRRQNPQASLFQVRAQLLGYPIPPKPDRDLQAKIRRCTKSLESKELLSDGPEWVLRAKTAAQVLNDAGLSRERRPSRAAPALRRQNPRDRDVSR